MVPEFQILGWGQGTESPILALGMKMGTVTVDQIPGSVDG